MSLSSLYLDAFYTTALMGHFTKASEELCITQSALSQRISKLEADLGTSLFIRESTGIRLTPAGEELLLYCKHKESLELTALENIRGESKTQLTGVVKIGGFSSVMRSIVLPLISPLLQENPKLKLSLISKEMDELPKLFKRGEIDYMIYYNDLIKDNVEILPLGTERNYLAEKKGYCGEEIFLDHDENDQTTARYLKLFKKQKSYKRRYLDDVYGLIDGVKNGLGRAVIPEHLIVQEPSLKIINKSKSVDFPVKLHFFKQPFYSSLHSQLISVLKKGFKQTLK